MIITTRKRIPSLMRKLIIYFLIIILIMFSLNAYAIYRFKFFYSNFYTMLKQLVDIHSISLQTDDLYQQVDNFIHSGNRDYIKDYNEKLLNIQESMEYLKGNTNGPNYYKLKDLGNMFVTFQEKSQNIFSSFDKGTQKIYINQMAAELSRYKGYIQDEVKDILLVQLMSVQSYYSGFWKKILSGENLMYILTALITLLCLLFAFEFSRQISVPIHQLVMRLQKVADGDLDVDKVEAKTNDEIGILVDSFNYMTVQLRSLIKRIREKANVERQLKEQEIKNLEISNLLNQSELNFLQSQINPHFLFNTLNSIAALAEIEEASQTKLMLESMSSILRYNLKKLNHNVTLGEEVEIIKNYLYIQRTRFGNRLEFNVNIDEDVMSYTVPSMILQPFVENSIIHGLEPKEGKGVLELSMFDCEKDIEIIIKDNGIGIPKEKLETILDYKNGGKDDSKGGIGVVNVLRRLEIAYGKKLVGISSEPGVGTEVRMKLPKSS